MKFLTLNLCGLIPFLLVLRHSNYCAFLLYSGFLKSVLLSSHLRFSYSSYITQMLAYGKHWKPELGDLDVTWRKGMSKPPPRHRRPRQRARVAIKKVGDAIFGPGKKYRVL